METNRSQDPRDQITKSRSQCLPRSQFRKRLQEKLRSSSGIKEFKYQFLKCAVAQNRERSQGEIETEFPQFSTPKTQVKNYRKENKKTQRKRIQFSSQKLSQMSSALSKSSLAKIPKSKSSLKTLNPKLFIHFLLMIFKP